MPSPPPPPPRPQPKDGPSWNDQLTLVHVTTKGPRADGKTPRPEKEREREAWDSGGPTIPDVATAVQPYNCAIQELEVREARREASRGPRRGAAAAHGGLGDGG